MAAWSVGRECGDELSAPSTGPEREVVVQMSGILTQGSVKSVLGRVAVLRTSDVQGNVLAVVV